MEIEIPFDYINILVFSILLKYENKRSIKIDTLAKYHHMLLKEVFKVYESGEVEFGGEADQWAGKIEFVAGENDNIDNFLSNYSHLFYRKGDLICLYDHVEYSELINKEKEIRDDQNISHRFFAASSNDCLLDLLNVGKIRTVIEKYVDIERDIEKCYSLLNQTNSSDENIRQLMKLLFTRALFFNNVCQNPRYVLDAFRLESWRVYQADSTFRYSKLPIDLDLWKDSEYYVDWENDIGDIDDRIYDIFQYAIFGETSLIYKKMKEMLTNLYFSGDPKQNFEVCLDAFGGKFDDQNTYYAISTEENDLAFYLNYLAKLNKYMGKYGETPDLLQTKNRLLYALDMPSLGLYDEANFEQQLVSYQNFEFDEEDFDFLAAEIRFMADEVFMVEPDANTVKKLLLISTYYELSEDDEIKDIVNSHNDDDNFEFYSEIIFGETKKDVKTLNKK